MNDFYLRMMRAGARLIFWIAVILLLIHLIDAALSIKLMEQMSERQGSFGPSISLVNFIPKILEGFGWPVLLLALAMMIDRLEVIARREAAE